MMIVQHPFVTPTLTLTLPNPQFGNVQQLKIRTNIKFAMDGSIRTHIKTPRFKRLVYSFKYLDCVTDIVPLVLDFHRATVGTDLRLTDHHNDVWRVRLVSTPIQFTEPRPSMLSFTLEFEGALDA